MCATYQQWIAITECVRGISTLVRILILLIILLQLLSWINTLESLLAPNHGPVLFYESFIQVSSWVSPIPSNDKWRLLVVVVFLLTLTTVPQVFRLKWRLTWVPLETPRHEEFDKKSSRPPTRSLGTDTSIELGSHCTGTGQETGNIHTIWTSVFQVKHPTDFQVKAVKSCGNVCQCFPF